MSSPTHKQACEHADLVYAYAAHAVSGDEARAVEAHVAECEECRGELASLRPVVDSFDAWPTNVLRPSPTLWTQLSHRIAAEIGEKPIAAPDARTWSEPEWEEAAPGIFCKLLATDTERNRVSMLVRLEPGISYPPHTHAGVEELHLLEGELWIDDRKLYPGDYNRGEPGASDQRVWSETGCTCVLITSPGDILR